MLGLDCFCLFEEKSEEDTLRLLLSIFLTKSGGEFHNKRKGTLRDAY